MTKYEFQISSATKKNVKEKKNDDFSFKAVKSWAKKKTFLIGCCFCLCD